MVIVIIIKAVMYICSKLHISGNIFPCKTGKLADLLRGTVIQKSKFIHVFFRHRAATPVFYKQFRNAEAGTDMIGDKTGEGDKIVIISAERVDKDAFLRDVRRPQKRAVTIYLIIGGNSDLILFEKGGKIVGGIRNFPALKLKLLCAGLFQGQRPDGGAVITDGIYRFLI